MDKGSGNLWIFEFERNPREGLASQKNLGTREFHPGTDISFLGKVLNLKIRIRNTTSPFKKEPTENYLTYLNEMSITFYP